MARDPFANPWKTLDTKVVYENAWIRVRENKVIRPDGNEGIYGIVDTRRAVGILALTQDDRLYLVGQYRYAMDEYTWEIIEGGSEGEEPTLETAKRELREEAGLVAERYRCIAAGIHVTNCHSSERLWIYVAEGLTQGPSAPEGTEDLQIKTVPFKDAVEMVMCGEILDSLSVMGILILQTERSVKSL